MKIGRWILLALVAAGAGAYGMHRYERTRAPSEPAQEDTVPGVRAPEGTRIKVEVLNATTTRGLARRATQFLRDRGFDVVATGTSRQQRKQTLVLDRSGHPEWAALVAAIMGARFEQRPDSSRYLDITVLIGSDWRPPPQPFYP